VTTVAAPFHAAVSTVEAVQKERIPALMASIEETVTAPPFMGAAAGALVAIPVTRRMPGFLRALLVPVAATVTGTVAYAAAHGKLPPMPAEIPTPTFAALELPAWLGTATGAKPAVPTPSTPEPEVDFGQSQPTDMDTYPSRRSGDGGSRAE
jgi:hypothetical protein